MLTLTAADGTSARCEVPYPPLAADGLEATAAVADSGSDRGPADAVVASAVRALVEHVLVERTTALVLVRRGGYAVGVVEHGHLVASKVGSRYVQGRTAAGGQSQQRFARRRANQASALVGSAADVAARVVEPFAAVLDAVVLGGDRLLLAELLGDARLAGLQRLPRGPFLDVADPRRRVLVDAVRRASAVPVLLRPGPS